MNELVCIQTQFNQLISGQLRCGVVSSSGIHNNWIIAQLKRLKFVQDSEFIFHNIYSLNSRIYQLLQDH